MKNPRIILTTSFAAIVAVACADDWEDLDLREAGTVSSHLSVPIGFTDTVIAQGISNATTFDFAPDGRVFIAEQGGALRILENATLLTQPFVTLPVDQAGERGLLGVTLHPNFAANPYVYVYYTATTPAVHNRVSRFTASGNVAVAGSEQVLIDLENLSSATNHNGGRIAFSPDGRLFVAVGDNSNGSNAQSMTTRLGKLLCINADGSIPATNPFVATTSGANRAIWALGLRNPFTFAFQPGTARLFINDVGAATWEEINEGVAGGNYGWPTTEGPTTDPRFRAPVLAYGHGVGPAVGCSIIGGAFYNPAVVEFPSNYLGKYFYADLCGGWIRTMDPANGFSGAPFATGALQPVDVKVHPSGSLYVLERGSGSLHRISSSSGQAPQIATHPASLTVPAGATAAFSCSASGTAPLSYGWQRNGVSVAGATSPTFALAGVAMSDNGATFRCVVSNVFGSATSNAATLTVTASSGPTAGILQPALGTKYRGGIAIAYSGVGLNAQGAELPGSAFTWWVDFHHDAHIHPFLPATTGVTGASFLVPVRGETAANVWYRIHLRVTDSSGLTAEATRDVFPETAALRLETLPSGLQVTLDGQPVVAPFSFVGVVGIVRSLGAVSPQSLNGTPYVFSRWSDSGAKVHDVSTPALGTTYRALFRPARAGLLGTYYDSTGFVAWRFARTDPTVNFSWGNGSPDLRLQPDTFSIRWAGFLRPLFSETYTLHVASDDGVRLWIDDVLVVSDWSDHLLREASGTVALTAGYLHSVRIDYYEQVASAGIELRWSSASQPKEIVPTTALFW